MRKIEFRAKKIDSDQWFYGGGIKQYAGGQTFLLSNNERDMPLIHVINPETVGQFTGLLSKSGKKIFEGDIVVKEICSKGDPAYGVYKENFGVKWFDEGAGFIFQKIDSPDDCWCPNEYSTANQWEVIGNLYDDPELLKP